MFDQNIFSKRVQQLRKETGLSQSALGEKIGLSKQAINDIEHGRYKTTLDKAVALAEFFHISLDYLVGISDDPKMY